MRHPAEYRDKEVVVLGLARSGQAVAKLFHTLGAKVVVNDRKEREHCPEADELEALGIAVLCGGHPDTLIHEDVELLVKNPGIPYSVLPIQTASRLGVEIVTEVEVAYHMCRSPIIGITGSNGKTTTTTWIGLMLAQAGLSPIVAGNIGKPLSEVCVEAEADDWLVAELSSFQLKGTVQFRPRIACLLNVYETHLDYHRTLSDYIASKKKMFENQTSEDIAVLNLDDPKCQQMAESLVSQLIPFSLKQTLRYGIYVSAADEDQAGQVVYRDKQGIEHPIIRVSDIGMPGKHNLENAMASAAVAIAAGVDIQSISEVLASFRGVEHRLEYVRTVKGTSYYNDSKATNPTATARALEGFSSNIVLIMGGLDRGTGYEELIPQLQDKVKAVIALGETRDKLKAVAEQAGVPSIRLIDKGQEQAREAMQEAVLAASEYAVENDVVLLSPGCASWDMYTSYEERGRIFKESVHNL